MVTHPRLRPLEIKRIQREGRWYFYLRDLLSLSGQDLLVPMELGPALVLLTGEHDLGVIRTRCMLTAGLSLTPGQLIDLVQRLDEALLLEGPRVDAAKVAAVEAFRAAPFRPSALAGGVYPAEPDALRSQLLAFEMQVSASVLASGTVAGILSPHIDYARGGPVYASCWRQGAAAVRAADLVIVLGTDHAGSGGLLTLTRQHYATPFGTLETDETLVSALAAALGEEAAFAEELHHRMEHSVELASIWLHHVRNGQSCRVLPVLCGHPGPFLARGDVAGEDRMNAALAVLREAVTGGALVVVAGDLAHVGPAFGDEKPFGARERSAVESADNALLAACTGGAPALLDIVRQIDDRYRICGLTPLALALAIMPPVTLQVAAYDQCPADDRNASFVSVAGGCFVRADQAPKSVG